MQYAAGDASWWGGGGDLQYGREYSLLGGEVRPGGAGRSHTVLNYRKFKKQNFNLDPLTIRDRMPGPLGGMFGHMEGIAQGKTDGWYGYRYLHTRRGGGGEGAVPLGLDELQMT
jgi:hypothetical protein